MITLPFDCDCDISDHSITSHLITANHSQGIMPAITIYTFASSLMRLFLLHIYSQTLDIINTQNTHTQWFAWCVLHFLLLFYHALGLYIWYALPSWSSSPCSTIVPWIQGPSSSLWIATVGHVWKDIGSLRVSMFKACFVWMSNCYSSFHHECTSRAICWS